MLSLSLESFSMALVYTCSLRRGVASTGGSSTASAEMRKSLSLGIYPDVTLAAAMRLRDEARALLAAGVNPSEERRQERANLRDEAVRLEAAMRFTLDSDGALSIRMGARRLNLNPSETSELRAFLDATRGVPVKE